MTTSSASATSNSCRPTGSPWLFVALLLLTGPVGILVLIARGAWPLIPVAVVWPPIVFLIIPRLAPVIQRAVRRRRGSGKRALDSRRRRVWQSACLPAIFPCVIVAALFTPAALAAFYEGAQAGAGVLILTALACPLYGWLAGRAERKEEEARAADEQRIRTWKCPHCGEPYGSDALLARFANSQNDSQPETERPSVGVQCARCRFGCVYNAAGAVLTQRADI